MATPVSESLPFGEVVSYSAPSPDHPTWNEDAAVVISCGQVGVLAVSDGAGGTPGGADAATVTIKSLQESMRSWDPQDSIRSVVLDAIEKADGAIRERLPGALATVALFIINGRRARAISVGDSISMVIGGRGKLKYRSVAHGPTGFAEEAGLLNPREAQVHEERHLVSNMLGLEGMRVEVGVPIQLAPRDTLLVACDALFDNVRYDEICRLLKSGPLKDSVDQLARRARKRMESEQPPAHPDDLTILACRLPRANAT